MKADAGTYNILITSKERDDSEGLFHVELQLNFKVKSLDNTWQCTKKFCVTSDLLAQTHVSLATGVDIDDYELSTSVTTCTVRHSPKQVKKVPVVNKIGRPAEYIKYVNSEAQIALTNWRHRNNISGKSQ